MGAWGPGIFSDDLACDVRDEFRALIEDGVDPAAATEQMIQAYAESVDDRDERTAFWTGLAATQFKLGCLQPLVRDRAIAVIDAGGDTHLYFDERTAKKRVAALGKLRGQLVGPQRSPVKVRKPTRVPSPIKTGDIVRFDLGDGRTVRLRTISIDEDRTGAFPIIELIDDEGRTAFEKRGGKVTRESMKRVQYELVAPRLKDLPGREDAVVVGKDRFAVNPPVETRSYTTWATFKSICRRIIDDPATEWRADV